MTVKNRLREYIGYKGMSMRGFSASIGMSPAYANNIKNSIQPSVVHNISERYPDLNTGWLLTGEGDMINGQRSDLIAHNSGRTVEVNENLLKILRLQAESLERKDRQIDELITLLKGQK